MRCELAHNVAEPSHARERRWPADFETNVNSRRPVMRVVHGVKTHSAIMSQVFAFLLIPTLLFSLSIHNLDPLPFYSSTTVMISARPTSEIPLWFERKPVILQDFSPISETPTVLNWETGATVVEKRLLAGSSLLVFHMLLDNAQFVDAICRLTFASLLPFGVILISRRFIRRLWNGNY